MIFVDKQYLGIAEANFPIKQTAQKESNQLRIGIVNLMPDKPQNELAWLRAFSEVETDICISFLRLEGQRSTSKTYGDYVASAYEEATANTLAHLDILCVTGVPVGHLNDPFLEFRYWDALCGMFDLAKRAGISILGSCWGGNALLKYRHEITTEKFGIKHLGLFKQHLLASKSDLRFADHLPEVMAVTRRLTVPLHNIPADANIDVLWGSTETGVFLAVDRQSHDLFMLNHVEYDYGQLISEYERDVGADLKIVGGTLPIQSSEAKQWAISWQKAGRRVIRDWVAWQRS